MKKLYHRFLKTKDQHDYQMYAKYRNQAKNSGRKAVTDYEKPLSRGVKSNPKTFFRYPKSKLNFKNAIPDLVDNGKILSDDNSKAKAFNMFFKSVFTEEYNYQIYGKHRNQAKNSGRKAVTDYEKPLPREVKSNPKVFFRYAKGKLNFKNAIPDLADNGKILSDGNSKAKAFNMFFKSVLQRKRLPNVC